MVRTERESNRRRREVEDLLVFPRPGKSMQNGAGFSIMGLLKRKGWPQCHRESSLQVHQSCLYQKGKEQRRLSRAPDCKEGIQC